MFDREKVMLNAMTDLINRYPLKFCVEDEWKWRDGPKGVYSTENEYKKYSSKIARRR